MIRLFVDTSSKNLNISIIKDNEIIASNVEQIEKDMSVLFIPKVDKLLKSNNLSVKDINEIYVVVGPGSFTGIRIGLTFCKVLAWSLNIKLIPISSLELMASSNFNGKYISPIIDARRDNVYGAIYDNELNIIHKEEFVSFEKFSNYAKNKNTTYVSYDKFKVENIILPEPNIIKCILRHENDELINPHSINPNYLKLTEAEENFQKNDKRNN